MQRLGFNIECTDKTCWFCLNRDGAVGLFTLLLRSCSDDCPIFRSVWLDEARYHSAGSDSTGSTGDRWHRSVPLCLEMMWMFGEQELWEQTSSSAALSLGAFHFWRYYFSRT
ncbi:unnamed protein product [Symbiodinium necroappetens]|uniref:Uncharacterized protein n=1 Tax=Symbiodinium necroappetens TaxID=1628268 RepID=A0A813C0T2_9DINO|nr:unnamed protein product [Symbiodinium sp. CCMP2456]CAE7932330.1 unnamed protein product [Symbiodinium necroappetens]